MKKIFLSALFVLLAAGAASAQNCIIIDSEKVFKSLAEYTSALDTLDKLGEAYQADVDKRFAEVENLYNTYMAQKASLSAVSRAKRRSCKKRRRRPNTSRASSEPTAR